MSDLTPITREEALLDGQDLTPITRKELFIKRIYDKTTRIPEVKTREEWFLKKAGESIPDIDIEQLSVSQNGTYSESGKAYSPVIVEVPQPTITKLTATENKTYTAPSGTAYDEVDVNVPLPENAYLLKDIEGTPSDIATFTDGSSLPMPKLEVAIEPIQDLHGYDAPWVGGAGKNKFYIDLPHEDVSGSSTYLYELTLKPNTAYTMSSNVPQDNPASLYFNGGTSYVNGVWNGTPRTFTSDENGNLTVYVRYTTIQGGIDLYTAVKNGTYYIQLEEGQTATSFAPYSNICPISGWDEAKVTRCGINIWDEEWEHKKGYSSGSTLSSNTNIASKNYISCKPSTAYYFKIPSTLQIYVYQYDSIKGFIKANAVNSSEALTTESNTAFLKFASKNDKYSGDYNNDISINYPSTDTSYHAYNGQTYTIDLDGTRYGGKVDVINGVMTVDRVMVDLDNATMITTNNRCYYNSVKTLIKIPTSQSVLGNYMAEKYKQIPFNGTLVDGEYAVGQDGVIIFYYDGVNKPTGKLVYELATPIIYQLTPTQVRSLLGNNNIFADTGNVLECEYFGE